MKKHLRHGYTTGACSAAAAKGAALLLRDREPAETVAITLPRGEVVTFKLNRMKLDQEMAFCSVIKDAGDDPDITNGAEIQARLFLTPPFPPGERRNSVVIEGGEGIGRVTKPGLAVAVGEWAINPVPRLMIESAVNEVYPIHDSRFTIHVEISIPDGEERAKKTLNERLGIIGGLSILGTTGIVRPLSAQAWTDTIDTAIDVALACGSKTVVLSTGRTSELVVQKHFGSVDLGSGIGKGLPEEAYVMMGDHVGHSLRACAFKGVREVVVAGQFAKLLKIACGHEQTHVSSSELDLRMLAEWLQEAAPDSPVAMSALHANTARQVLEESEHDPLLVTLVCGRAKSFAQRVTEDVAVKVLLAGYAGEVLYFG